VASSSRESLRIRQGKRWNGHAAPNRVEPSRGTVREDLMQFLLRLSRAMDAVSDWVGRMLIWALFATVIVSAANAIVRKVFSVGSNGWKRSGTCSRRCSCSAPATPSCTTRTSASTSSRAS
jgi:hypothetical protein